MLILFCKDSVCRKFICRICLIQNHKLHDFLDIVEGEQIVKAEQEQKRVLLREIGKELSVLEKFSSSTERTGGQVIQQLDTTLETLRREKNAIAERIEQVGREKDQTKKQIEKVKADLDLLRSMGDTANKSENIQHVSDAFKEIRAKTRESAHGVVFNYTQADEKKITEIVETTLNKHLVLKREDVSSPWPLSKFTFQRMFLV